MGSKTESCPNCGTGVTVPDVRIYTRCPACHNDTLTVHDNRLLCTWHKCPDPTRIDRDVVEKIMLKEATALADLLSDTERRNSMLLRILEHYSGSEYPEHVLLRKWLSESLDKLTALRHAISILKQVGAL